MKIKLPQDPLFQKNLKFWQSQTPAVHTSCNVGSQGLIVHDELKEENGTKKTIWH